MTGAARRPLPDLAADPRVAQGGRMTSNGSSPGSRLHGRDLTLAYDAPRRLRAARRRDPRRLVHRRSSGPTRAASRRCCARWPACSSRRRAPCCSTAQAIGSLAVQGGRAPARPAAADARSPRTGSRSPTSSRAGATRTSGCCASGRATTSAPCTRRCARRGVEDLADARRRRALRRPAPARLARDGARPGDAAAAARRADDVPRHRAPDRGARPLRGPARAPRAHARRRPARPQPRLPLRHAT